MAKINTNLSQFILLDTRAAWTGIMKYYRYCHWSIEIFKIVPIFIDNIYLVIALGDINIYIMFVRGI